MERRRVPAPLYEDGGTGALPVARELPRGKEHFLEAV